VNIIGEDNLIITYYFIALMLICRYIDIAIMK